MSDADILVALSGAAAGTAPTFETQTRSPQFSHNDAACMSVNRMGRTGMWWLQFADGGAAIVAATTLAQARLIAVIHGFGRASTLIEGYAIDADFLQLIPDNRIGKKLSKPEVDEVLERLRIASGDATRAACLSGPIPPSA